MQIYACATTADGPKWQLFGPRANLYGEGGRLIATHFTGPTWQAKDGSQVKAARVDGVGLEPTAIPCLLLKATTTTAGPRGDRLVRTSYIQRIATAGGLEPAAADCNSASLGTVRETPYTADYVFWKAKA